MCPEDCAWTHDPPPSSRGTLSATGLLSAGTLLLRLLGMVACAMTCFGGVARSTSLTVPDDVPTIQGAANARPDTIRVRPGLYAETPILTQPVSILAMVSATDSAPDISGIRIEPGPSAASTTFLLRGVAFDDAVIIANDYAHCGFVFEGCDLHTGITDVSTYTETVEVTLDGCTLIGATTLRVINLVKIDSCTVTGTIMVGGDMPAVVIRGCKFEGDGAGTAFGIERCDNLVVEGTTISNYGLGIGVGVDGGAILRNNIIVDCAYEGVFIGYHSIEAIDNVVRRCGIGMDLVAFDFAAVDSNVVTGCLDLGIRLQLEGDGRVAGNVVSDCGGDGIYVFGDVVGSFGVTQNTVARNAGAGLAWNVASLYYAATAVVDGNIGYANGTNGVRWATNNATAVGCNDWFGNRGGDVSGRPPSPQDLSVNPQFCDSGTGDFHLLAASPLVSWPDCGQIGALGVGCAVTATQVTRFGADRVSGGIRILWLLADGSTASDVWLERSDTGPDGPWIRPLTDRSHDGPMAVELDRAVASDQAYWYRLVAREGISTVIIGQPIAVEAEADIPFAIRQMGPNPSAGPVRIEFGLRIAASIEIDVFDVQGRVVASPARGVWPAGKHTVVWSGMVGASFSAAGMYLVRYRYPGGEDRRRLVRVL
jgi:hypothetical protein